MRRNTQILLIFAALPLALVAGHAATRAPAAPLLTGGLGPAPGQLLVAGRQLRDPNFAETVVLLVEAGREGALGLILNRPTVAVLDELVPELEMEGTRERPVYFGGPVGIGQLLLLLRREAVPEGARQVLRGVHFSGSREVLDRLARGELAVDDYRAYAGHAGWAPGQLEAEISRGSWQLRGGHAGVVFDRDPGTLWQDLIARGAAQVAGLLESPAPPSAWRPGAGEGEERPSPARLWER